MTKTHPFSFLHLLIFLSVLSVSGTVQSSYGQEGDLVTTDEPPNAESPLQITDLSVSSTTVAVNETITMRGVIVNTGDVVANNTSVTLFSTYRPSVNVTSLEPADPVHIRPGQSITFEFEFLPTEPGEIEMSAIAFSNRGERVISEPTTIMVLDPNQQVENSIPHAVLLALISAAGIASILTIFKLRKRSSSTR